MKHKFKNIILSLLLFVLATVFTACQVQSPVRTGNTTTAGISQTQVGTQAVTQAGTKAQTTKPQITKPAVTKPTVTKAPATKPTATKPTEQGLGAIKVTEAGRYTSKLEVAAYLFQFKKLPSNFITKNKAQDLGWVASKGNLWKVTDQMSIGGDKFGNFEGRLPKKNGRQYYEADIDYRGGTRGPKRIVYSNDGLIYYTEDHYNSFEKLN